MMPEKVLITGGAGFIGSHLARHLLGHGHRVRALDALDEQVHGAAQRPAYLRQEVELVVGDVRDPETVRSALRGVDSVVHLAARVGVGQSMYEMASYQAVNSFGTAVLLDALAKSPIRKLVVASSMSIYGEGLYRVADGRLVEDVVRHRPQLELDAWEPESPDGQPLEPLPTPEWKQPRLSSVYALGKYDQERMCLLFGDAYDLPTVALRFFNVYGPDQALSNPYTGVLAIFANRLLNHRPPQLFEDGEQRRDFVSVHDVARACCLALHRDGADGEAVNVGSGQSVTVSQLAHELAQVIGRPEIPPRVTGRYRVGDIRHCFADIERVRRTLSFEPRVSLADGMAELAEWLEGRSSEDRVDAAAAELEVRGLTV
jgi:dTDP-L-rhamnose 4-epimerase